MITNDVPMAMGISTPSISTRAGMIKKPPPTPNRPVRMPTSNPRRDGPRRAPTPVDPVVADGAGGPGAVLVAQHLHSGEDHDRGEADQDRSLGGQELADSSTDERRGGDACQSEDPGQTPLHVPDPDLRQCADRGCRGDHDQRDRDGLPDIQLNDVDQRRNGQDRAAATE